MNQINPGKKWNRSEILLPPVLFPKPVAWY